MLSLFSGFLACVATLAGSDPVAAQISACPSVRISGRDVDLGPSPLLSEIAENSLATGDYLLFDERSHAGLPATVYEERGKRLLAVVLDELKAGESRTLRALKQPACVVPRIEVAPGPEGSFRVEVEGREFTSLRPGPRKPYFYPVIGPSRAEFTRAYPMREVEGESRDHPHQRSMWLTHGDVNGFDFWASDPLNGKNPRFGTIEQQGKSEAISGIALGVLRTNNRWLDPTATSLCLDERTWRFWDFQGTRVIDCDVTLKALDADLTFGDTKEGTFGLRVPSSMDANKGQGGQIVNAEGLRDTAAWGKRSAWVDYSGPVDGELVGIAILNHPESFRFPTAWHVRDYGLFAANPFGYHDFGIKEPGRFTLAPGETLHLSYRVILHLGRAEQGRIVEQFQAYAKPPRVEVL
jgi:hypothetical protein